LLRQVSDASPDNPLVLEATTLLNEYQAALDAAELTDAHVARNPGNCAVCLLYATSWMLLWVVICAIGIGSWVFFLPYWSLSVCLVEKQVEAYVAGGFETPF